MNNKLVNSGHYNESAHLSSSEKEIAHFQLEGYYSAARELINIALAKGKIDSRGVQGVFTFLLGVCNNLAILFEGKKDGFWCNKFLVNTKYKNCLELYLHNLIINQYS